MGLQKDLKLFLIQLMHLNRTPVLMKARNAPVYTCVLSRVHTMWFMSALQLLLVRLYEQDPKYKPCYTGISVVRLYNSQVSLKNGHRHKIYIVNLWHVLWRWCVWSKGFFFFCAPKGSLFHSCHRRSHTAGLWQNLKTSDRISSDCNGHPSAFSTHVKLVIKGYSFWLE